MYLFILLAVLGLRCCMQVFSSFGEQGLLPTGGAQASHCSGFYHGARVLGTQASVTVTHELSSCSLWAPEHKHIAVAYRLHCSVAWELLLNKASNLFPSHWKTGSYPLLHEGSL